MLASSLTFFRKAGVQRMPRVLGLIIIFLLGLGLAAFVARRAEQARGSQPQNTYRPRRRSKSFQATSADVGESAFVMKRTEAQSVSDAFTGARINPDANIWRCMGCQSMYHETSMRALEKDLGRACVNCESRDQRPVYFEDF
jgi:hypothetical protein